MDSKKRGGKVGEMIDFIKYRGLSSDKFGIRVINDMEYSSPEADISFEELPGVDGDIAIDNKRYKGVKRNWPVRFISPEDARVEKQAKKIADWLKSKPGWDYLEWSGDPDYVYLALYYESIDVKRLLLNFGSAVLKFRLKPHKYIKWGLSPKDITKTKILNNPEKFDSLPLIELKAVGSVDLIINEKRFSLKNLNGSITIDCDAQYCSDSGGNANEKAEFYPYPKLSPGENVFRWEGQGSVTRLVVTPRWRCLV